MEQDATRLPKVGVELQLRVPLFFPVCFWPSYAHNLIEDGYIIEAHFCAEIQCLDVII